MTATTRHVEHGRELFARGFDDGTHTAQTGFLQVARSTTTSNFGPMEQKEAVMIKSAQIGGILSW